MYELQKCNILNETNIVEEKVYKHLYLLETAHPRTTKQLTRT